MGGFSKKAWAYVFLMVALLVSAFEVTKEIKYFQSRTIALKADHVKKYRVDFKDSIFSDTLFQVNSREGYPISYFRKIQADICFDQKCRILDIILHWNVTGRYLGFELRGDEFLSKTDHEPFNEKEYDRLHQILANASSPIANFTYNQLVLKPASNYPELDGITSATLPAILDHIVPGAAYTTYKLWHIIYGATQSEVEKLTTKALNAEFMLKIFESPDESDKMWALNHLNGHVRLNTQLRNTIISLINNDNFSVAERAVSAIDPIELKSDSLQLLLLERFYHTDYSIKKLLIDKLGESPRMSQEVEMNLTDSLHNFNGEILSRVLEVFKRHKISNLHTYRKVALLLEHKNHFISRKAFNFLKSSAVQDEEIKKSIQTYHSKNQ